MKKRLKQNKVLDSSYQATRIFKAKRCIFHALGKSGTVCMEHSATAGEVARPETVTNIVSFIAFWTII